MRIKRYSELRYFETFEERFEYLKIGGSVGVSTFGFDRYINQGFYASAQWKRIRQQIILRDNSCDLGIPGYEIHESLLVHHINPIDADNIVQGESWILDPDFLITTTQRTHNAIHYGDASLLYQVHVERYSGDTKLW